MGIQLMQKLPDYATPKDEKVLEDIVNDEILNEILVQGADYPCEDWRWIPVPIKDWILGEDYLNLKDIIRPCVLDDIVNFFETKDGNPWHRKYDLAVLCEGIGSGKSFKISIIATYFLHLLLCLRDPQSYFSSGKTSKIAIMNMSISERNAKKVIFSEIASKINTCKWFLDRPWERPDSRMPDPQCPSELRFKNNVFIIPGSGSWRTAVGYNIIVGIMDEGGSYRATDNSDQAEDIYNTLQRRLGSRFEDKGAIVIGGSPMYESDFLEKKIKEGEVPDSRIYAKRRTLWEAKYPDWDGEFFYVDRINRIVLDKKPDNMKDVDVIPKVPFLYKAFIASPTKAYRDFGAMPSPTLNPFFESPKMLLERYNPDRKHDPIRKDGTIENWFTPIDRMSFHTIHIDLALTGDACGFALGHNAGSTEEGGTKIYIDLMMRIKGSKEAPVRIGKVREYIYALTALGFPIGLVTYDGFQSSDSMQILEGKGYRTEYLSVDRTMAPYSNFKESITENRLDYYYIKSGDESEPSASEVFIREAMQLEEIRGKKIDHPPKGSKDVADAVAGVVHNILENSDYYGTLQVA